MLKRHSWRVRSAPAYVSLGDEVVSLVLEGEREGGPGGENVRPTAVYLIDRSGVRRLGAQSGRWSATAVAFVAVGVCLQYALRRWMRRAPKRG